MSVKIEPVKSQPEIVLIIDSVRSLYNVGSILRTADGFGVSKIYALGSTPFPEQPLEKRLPHVVSRATRQLQKTALGAEKYIVCEPHSNPLDLIKQLKMQGYIIVSLEQTDKSIEISKFKPKEKLALIIGNEVDGVSQVLLDQSDTVIEICMLGSKNSLNVGAATAVALFYLSSYKL